MTHRWDLNPGQLLTRSTSTTELQVTKVCMLKCDVDAIRSSIVVSAELTDLTRAGDQPRTSAIPKKENK